MAYLNGRSNRLGFRQLDAVGDYRQHRILQGVIVNQLTSNDIGTGNNRACIMDKRPFCLNHSATATSSEESRLHVHAVIDMGSLCQTTWQPRQGYGIGCDDNIGPNMPKPP